MKKILSICLVLMMVLALAPTAFAASFGGNLGSWSISNGVLTISGDMPNYAKGDERPWENETFNKVKVNGNKKGQGNVGSYAFAGFTNIETVELDQNVIIVGEHAFDGCTGIKTVTMSHADSGNSSNTHEIAAGAFSGCTGITSITLPNTLTDLGSGAFQGCTKLTTVNYGGNSLQNVGDGVFAGCSSLTLDGIADLAGFVNTDDVLGLPEIKNLALGLSDDILVMFRVYVPANVTTSDFSVHFTTKYEGVTYRDVTVAYDDAKPIDGALNDRYFCLNITAQELNDDITAQVYIGSEAKGEPKALSAMYYIDYVKDNYAPDSALYKLVDALQAYGYYLQNSGWTDNFGDHADIPVPALTIDTDYVAGKLTDLGVDADVTYSSEKFPSRVSVSLTLNTKTSIKVTDKATNETKTQTGIGPKDLGKTYDILFTNGGTVSISALSYVKLVLNSSMTAAKKDAMAALYYYYEAAVAYN